jgi:hypothetical protein
LTLFFIASSFPFPLPTFFLFVFLVDKDARRASEQNEMEKAPTSSEAG